MKNAVSEQPMGIEQDIAEELKDCVHRVRSVHLQLTKAWPDNTIAFVTVMYRGSMNADRILTATGRVREILERRGVMGAMPAISWRKRE